MKYDFEDLQCLLQLYRDGSFTEAAKNLYITQPVLSRKIRRFETETGVKMFQRSTHHVSLTPEGKIILQQVEAILKQRDELNDTLRFLHSEDQLLIRLAYGSFSEFQYIEKIAGIMGQEGGKARLVFKQYRALELLYEGLIDAAIINESEAEGADWLETCRLSGAGLSVFMTKQDPLFHRQRLSLSDLSGRAILIPNRTQSEKDIPYQNINQHLRQLLREAGIEERFVQDKVGLQQFSVAILGEHALGLLPDTARLENPLMFVGKHLVDHREGFGTVLVWKKGNESASLHKLWDVLSQMDLDASEDSLGE